MTAPASSSARFLIVGPQGSGKGTQGVLVADAFEVPSISTGDVFRENISGGTALGGRFLASRGEALDAVIELVVPREESIARLRQRVIDQGRTDDTEEVIANRLAIYERETAPILDAYRGRGLVVRIDGVGSLAEVTARIFEALASRELVPAHPVHGAA